MSPAQEEKLRKIHKKYQRKMNHNGYTPNPHHRRIYAELTGVLKQYDNTRSLPFGAFDRVCAEMHCDIHIRSLKERGIWKD